MIHEHFMEEGDRSRFPECPCGAVYWTGGRWTAMPDPSQYIDADAARAGVER